RKQPRAKHPGKADDRPQSPTVSILRLVSCPLAVHHSTGMTGYHGRRYIFVSADGWGCNTAQPSAATRPPRPAPAAADELDHDFSPVRPGAMLGDIDALPRAKRKFAGADRYLHRDPCEHGLHVRRHIVGSFDI